MAAVKFTLTGDMVISYDLVKKHPVPTKRATVILIKVKSCNAFLHVLLVCIGSYLQSSSHIYIYKPLILSNYHPGNLYLHVSIRGHSLKSKGAREQQT
jgi:hypothetical protein